MNINDIFNIIIINTGATNESVGTIIYIFSLFFITAFTYKKSLILTLIFMIPVTLLFLELKILDKQFAILLTAISILGLALTARQVMK